MRGFLILLLALIVAGCARPPKEPYLPPPSKEISRPLPGWMKPYTINGQTYYPLPSAEGYEEECLASWYGPGFHGQETSSGEIFNMYEFSAAHKLLPLGTYVLVKNLENGRELVVRINDRGPFVGERCIDLSYAAARELGIIGKGLAKVKIIALSEGEYQGNTLVYKNVPNFRFNKFYLQVGAFKIYSNALRYKLELERQFEQVEIEPYQDPQKGLLYRVQIYLSDDLYKARALAEKLKAEGFRTAFLVAK
ncbi:MAG: septal ring lytic transglycosylase RlpA family protein [Caldimicrobium sp.]|uniref:Probable endolytic peptidoglycan transglycosylase RlpA n=1 Tax=Caldimicrobium thiodismutans TaxID=1653476 RepID=A0A2N7PJZ5_9BACT|nr:MAG: septal ring lytic transglycosylase RlpA family lipoprotein [Caldimicrobium thiodismutans]